MTGDNQGALTIFVGWPVSKASQPSKSIHPGDNDIIIFGHRRQLPWRRNQT